MRGEGTRAGSKGGSIGRETGVELYNLLSHRLHCFPTQVWGLRPATFSGDGFGWCVVSGLSVPHICESTHVFVV